MPTFRIKDGLDVAILAALVLLCVLAPFHRRRLIGRAIGGLVLALVLAGVAGVVRDWWIGEWEIGPYLTPVRVIVPDGRHPYGDAARPFKRGGDPRFYWLAYLGLANYGLQWCRDWRQSRRRLQDAETPPSPDTSSA